MLKQHHYSEASQLFPDTDFVQNISFHDRSNLLNDLQPIAIQNIRIWKFDCKTVQNKFADFSVV